MSLPFVYGATLIATFAPATLHAQSMLAGDIAGTVLDPSGAAVAGATVTATSQETGAVNTTTSSGTGAYRFSLLKPGTYKLSASKTGFKASTTTVNVKLGQITTQSMTLSLGQASETVQVSAAPQLLQTDTAQLTTTVNEEQLQNIPNPGSDITYIAQSRPGIVMNTGANSSSGTLGYGNFSAFGLPGTSNNFTINGMEVNDPFLNLNNSGPSNLLLGMNDIQETDVITNAYETQYGTFGGVQLNSISRSGSDKFHGNLNYAWNGRYLNANDWFNKNPLFSSPTVPRPFSNFNQWAAAIGGPIKRNKLFFFVNTEGISFITSSQQVVDLPSPTYEASVVGANGACSDASSSLFTNGAASQCAFYNHIFALYNGTPNYASASPVPGGGGADLQLSAPSRFNLTERLITGRLDFDFTPNDKAFAHFKYDHGVQPTYTDPINSAFDAQSDQPDYEGQFAWTHTFGARAVNQLLLTGSWYSAVFLNVNPTTELATFPMEMTWLDGFANDLNNDADLWPEGRNATQYQIGDDFSYTVGRHTFKTGFQLKKDDVSDQDTGILTVPLVFEDSATFALGQSDGGLQNFTTNLNLPLSLYTLGVYFEDDFKPAANATITAGVRVERNSNVSCSRNCLSNFGGSFFNLAASAPLDSANAPYNSQIKYNLNQAFTSFQPYMVEPRIGFTFSPTSRTVIRGGFGIFTDVFPGTIADTMLDNPPLSVEFQILGPSLNSAGPTMALNPTDPTSYQSLAAAANSTFRTQFTAGSTAAACPVAGAGSLGSDTCMTAVNPNFAPPSITTVQGKLHYPTYDEYNLQIQQQFSKSESIQIGYVGNRGYHEPNQNVGVNGSGPLPATPPAPSFGPVNEVESEAVSNFNGLIVSWLHEGHGLTAQFNYQWSHALDEISNGGILPFNAASIYNQINPYSLSSQYGNSDYDVRQYFSGNYLYMMPHFGGPAALTGGWTIGGTIYWNTGNPFTPAEYVSDYGITNYGNGQNLTQIAPLPGVNVAHHCGPSSAVSPCLDASNFAAVSVTGVGTAFGAYDRNQFFGPHFFDTDMTLMKGFHLPHLGEQSKLEVGATAFNLLNHPNFGLPVANVDATHFGQSLYMEGPPTSIYGSGVGGDPSIRILELNGKVTF